MFVRSLAVALILIAAARAVLAQTPAPPPTVTAGPAGMAIQSADQAFRLQIGALVHTDGRFAIDDDAAAVTSTFAVRRLRPYLRGRFARRFEFYVNPDFAGGTVVLQDAYVDTVFSNAFRLRAGKQKVPFGLERLHSASNLLFFERALPTALAPNRDIGLQVLGDLGGTRLSYAVGVTNGTPDGGSADTDTNDSKDIAGRIVVRPLAGLSLALSASLGTQAGAAALPAFRTSSLQQPFFSYTGSVADGRRARYSPQFSVYRGAFGAFGEFVHTETKVARGAAVRREVGHDAWQVAASWVLTGEDATDAGSGVVPRAAFDFGNGSWGAFQVAARYHALAVDDEVFALALATAGSSRQAEAFTVGLNWYLTQNVRYTFNFERTVFDGDGDGPRPAENAALFRTQINF